MIALNVAIGDDGREAYNTFSYITPRAMETKAYLGDLRTVALLVEADRIRSLGLVESKALNFSSRFSSIRNQSLAC